MAIGTSLEENIGTWLEVLNHVTKPPQQSLSFSEKMTDCSWRVVSSQLSVNPNCFFVVAKYYIILHNLSVIVNCDNNKVAYLKPTERWRLDKLDHYVYWVSLDHKQSTIGNDFSVSTVLHKT